MLSLTDKLVDKVEIGEYILNLDLAFDTVLLFYDLIDDKNFNMYEKTEIAFEMFVKDDIDFDSIEFEVKDKVLREIIEKVILGEENNSSKGNSGDSGRGNNKKLYDLKQDADYIYASFMQEYGVDLIDMQGVLRWEKFIALLSGLRDTTKFKEIVGIRGAELPKGNTEYDKQERKRIRNMQKIYALEKDQYDREKELDEMFNILAGGK